MDAEVRKIVDEAVEFADASPEPSPDALYEDVYAEPYGPYTRSQRGVAIGNDLSERAATGHISACSNISAPACRPATRLEAGGNAGTCGIRRPELASLPRNIGDLTVVSESTPMLAQSRSPTVTH